MWSAYGETAAWSSSRRGLHRLGPVRNDYCYRVFPSIWAIEYIPLSHPFFRLDEIHPTTTAIKLGSPGNKTHNCRQIIYPTYVSWLVLCSNRRPIHSCEDVDDHRSRNRRKASAWIIRVTTPGRWRHDNSVDFLIVRFTTQWAMAYPAVHSSSVDLRFVCRQARRNPTIPSLPRLIDHCNPDPLLARDFWRPVALQRSNGYRRAVQLIDQHLLLLR